MRERPILFSGPMVRALLDGSKTQTRRVAPIERLQITPYGDGSVTWSVNFAKAIKGVLGSHSGVKCTEEQARRIIASQFCSYGAPGDRLWVRETCRAEELPNGLDGIRYSADKAFVAIRGSDADRWIHLNAYRGKKGAVVPPIHMPRWASRITLEITGVRVERLQDISEEDARSEGAIHSPLLPMGWNKPGCDPQDGAMRSRFAALWDGLNAARGAGWDVNPWVWVVEFKRIDE